MDAFRTISDSVTEHIPEVLQQFDTVTEQEPWINLPAGYRTNYLGGVIAMATSLALLRPGDAELCEKMLYLAAHHGETRLEQGLSDSIIFQELYLIRESLWTYIKQFHEQHSGLRAEAIVRIDMALSLAAKASLRGYHRPAFEKRGEWPKVVDRLVREWAPPPPLEDLLEQLDT